MSQMFPSATSRTFVSGDVCTIRIFITSTDNKEDERLYYHFREIRSELKRQVDENVKKTLGEQFEVRRFSIDRGSIEFLILVGTTYYAVSKYKNFIESINLLAAQLRSLFSRIASAQTPSPIEVTGDWSPSPALVNAEIASSRVDSDPILLILLLYIILSHAAMLTVIIYQLLKK
jgi:hypothetical protein